MRQFHWLASVVMAALAVQGAAQPTPKPYAPVAVAPAHAVADRSFVAFRDALTAAARSRIYADLARLVRTEGFFWERDFGRAFDPRRPAVDNLAAALALERDGGRGWTLLASFAAEPSVAPLASRPGVVCAPAPPHYDSVAFARLLDQTYTRASDWAYPNSDNVAVRAAPQADAAMLGPLGPHFVLLLDFEGGKTEPAPGRTRWARVVMPDGRAGFVPPNSLRALGGERLCYRKDVVAGWQIAGYVGAGD